VTRLLARTATAAFCVFTLAGCIYSTAPVMTDAQPLLGERLRLQLYTLGDGAAREPMRVAFRWNGKYYAHARLTAHDISEFTVHSFEGGDFIVQSIPRDAKRNIEYAVMHPLTDGVYLLNAIDEADADDKTREAYCAKPAGSSLSCRIETREALLAFARATAARMKPGGGLAIRLAGKERP
jgi:hypothetical protein